MHPLIYHLAYFQTDNEAQRRHNAELVQMQESSSIRKEQARQATEEQIQAQQRQTEKERAEIERETVRVKAMAEAEGRAHEAKLTEDHNRRMLLERINGERDKWLAAINTTFNHIEGLCVVYILALLQYLHFLKHFNIQKFTKLGYLSCNQNDVVKDRMLVPLNATFDLCAVNCE